jgi:hypothetical protein
MAYIIYNNDGSVLASIPIGVVDSISTSLDLVGKNVDNYGQYLNNNLAKLLTSFSNNNQPAHPQPGQLWFNTNTKRLNVFDGTSFKPTYGATVNGTPTSTTSTGDLWYDTINSQLKVWNGYSYKLVGPAVSGLLGKFGIEPPASTIRDDDTNVTQKVAVLYSYGTAIGLITTSTFNMKSVDSAIYLGVGSVTPIINGTTFLRDIDVKADLYIKGDYYINGVKQFPNGQTLTATFDITPYGNPDPVMSGVATAKTNIEAGNIAIKNFLSLIFSTVTNVTYGELGYPINSNAKVVCLYSNGLSLDASVRRFKLIEDPIHPGINIWKWYDAYYTPSLSTVTNIVRI